MNNKPNLRPLIYSSLLFVSLLFLADRVIGYYLKSLYFSQKKGEFYETTYALNHVKEDVLIFGSSRAVRHYDPLVLGDSLKMTALNVGKLGNTLLYSDAVFSQILTYHKPKMVILDVSPIEFAASERERGQKSMLNTLLKYHDLPVIENRIKELSVRDLILSKLFWTYEFNSSIYTMLINDKGSSNLHQSKGFSARKGTKVTEYLVKEHNHSYKEDPLLIKTFHNFLEKAKRNNIQVHVVISPTTLYQSHNSVAKIKSITQKFDYDFIDVRHKPEFKKVSLYYDRTHLNEKGARKFSELIADSLDNNVIANGE
jgi:hypothetical protein